MSHEEWELGFIEALFVRLSISADMKKDVEDACRLQYGSPHGVAVCLSVCVSVCVSMSVSVCLYVEVPGGGAPCVLEIQFPLVSISAVSVFVLFSLYVRRSVCLPACVRCLSLCPSLPPSLPLSLRPSVPLSLPLSASLTSSLYPCLSPSLPPPRPSLACGHVFRSLSVFCLHFGLGECMCMCMCMCIDMYVCVCVCTHSTGGGPHRASP